MIISATATHCSSMHGTLFLMPVGMDLLTVLGSTQLECNNFETADLMVLDSLLLITASRLRVRS